MNSRISRLTSGSFERNIWCEPGNRTTRAVGTPVSTAFACFAVNASIVPKKAPRAFCTDGSLLSRIQRSGM